jgi:hypothetical protein
VADGWCWFVLREKYCWLVADKPNEHGVDVSSIILKMQPHRSTSLTYKSSTPLSDLLYFHPYLLLKIFIYRHNAVHDKYYKDIFIHTKSIVCSFFDKVCHKS